jgi:hypothetical protein
MWTDMTDERTTIVVSKPTHKRLSHRKIEEEYSSFEEMIEAEVLNGD